MKNLTVKEFRDNLALYLHLPVDTIIQVSGACWKRVELLQGTIIDWSGEVREHPPLVFPESANDPTLGRITKALDVSDQDMIDISNSIDKRRTDLVEAVEKASTCDRCKKNPPQRKIEEDGESYKVCESCLRKSFPLSRIKRLPLWKPE